MMYKSRSESWAWKIALHMCECFFCFGFSLQGARHTSRLIFRCWVVCMKDAALPRSVSKLSIDPIQRHSSYFRKCTGSSKRTLPNHRTLLLEPESSDLFSESSCAKQNTVCRDLRSIQKVEMIPCLKQLLRLYVYSKRRALVKWPSYNEVGFQEFQDHRKISRHRKLYKRSCEKERP